MIAYYSLLDRIGGHGLIKSFLWWWEKPSISVFSENSWKPRFGICGVSERVIWNGIEKMLVCRSKKMIDFSLILVGP